jgi:hypothetical protein
VVVSDVCTFSSLCTLDGVMSAVNVHEEVGMKWLKCQRIRSHSSRWVAYVSTPSLGCICCVPSINPPILLACDGVHHIFGRQSLSLFCTFLPRLAATSFLCCSGWLLCFGWSPWALGWSGCSVGVVIAVTVLNNNHALLAETVGGLARCLLCLGCDVVLLGWRVCWQRLIIFVTVLE